MARPLIAGIITIALAGATVPLAAGLADASPSCTQISADIAALDSHAAPVRSYAHAIAVQNSELERADMESRRLGCGFSVSGAAVERCASLSGQRQEMTDNLTQLRAEAARRDPNASERSRLIGLFASSGCARAPEPAEESRLRTAEAVSGGVRILRPGGDDLELGDVGADDPNHIVLQPQMPRFDANGAYRTMCVRTCDGYYFPISYAVSPGQFTEDEESCARRCPGTDVQLYYHRVPEEDAEQMISVSEGTPYTALPHAFLYRALNRRAAGRCTCEESAGGFSPNRSAAPSGFRVLEPGETPAPSASGSVVTIPAPAIEPPARTPTQDARLKADDPKPAAPATAPISTERLEKPRPPRNDEPVRVVGPKFFPDPSEAEVLRAPGPRPGQ